MQRGGIPRWGTPTRRWRTLLGALQRNEAALEQKRKTFNKEAVIASEMLPTIVGSIQRGNLLVVIQIYLEKRKSPHSEIPELPMTGFPVVRN